MSRAWMPLYIGDYLADTQHLTTMQHGAYLLLIMHYWQHGGLPSTEAAIAGISRLNRDQWRGNCSAIAGMFQAGWKHRRIDSELEKANNISEKRAFAGRRGAERTNRRNGHAFPAIARQEPTQSQSPIESYFPESQSNTQRHQNGQSVRDGKISPSLASIIKQKGWI